MIIKAARELQMMVVPEGGSLLYMNETHDARRPHRHRALAAGAASSTRTSSRSSARARRGYTPTLIVGYGGLFGENYWYQHTNVWENERLLTFTPRDGRRRALAAPADGAGGRLQPRAHRARA